MGGSILGAKSIYSYFKDKIKKEVFFFDNLDLNIYQNYKKIKNLKNSCFVVISKSGNTLETLTNFKTISSELLLKNNLIIITELKDSNLLSIGQKFNAEIIEHNSLIGGRYSVLSEAGMFPAALMNLKINKFKNLSKLLGNTNFVSSLLNSVSSIYTLNQQGLKNSVILNYDSKLNNLCFWLQQLIAESLGKKGKGITPIISQCPKDHHSLLQLYLDGPKDKFFTFLSSASNPNKKIEKTINAQCEATKNVFKNKKIPFRHLILRKNDEGELGATFTFFVLETILLARLMNINPFNQPAVEEVKIETKKILS
jgi:glucose-6-phosphate isomerase